MTNQEETLLHILECLRDMKGIDGSQVTVEDLQETIIDILTTLIYKN